MTNRGERSRGAGGPGWTPMPSSSSRDYEEERRSLDREIETLQDALRDRGELSRDALGEAVGARYWGPGRLRVALKVAVRRRAIRAPRRGIYGPR